MSDRVLIGVYVSGRMTFMPTDRSRERHTDPAKADWHDTSSEFFRYVTEEWLHGEVMLFGSVEDAYVKIMELEIGEDDGS